MSEQQWLFGAQEQRRLDLSQWYTPPKLAAKIWQWADGASARTIVEPSAGKGALILPGAADISKWTAYDVDPGNIEYLTTTFPGLNVKPMDWLADMTPGRFDLAISNVPYEDDQDVEHVMKCIRQCDRVVALLRSAFEHGDTRWKDFWRWVTPTREVTLATRPRFGGSGSPVSDFKLFEFVGGIRTVPRRLEEPVAVLKCVWP